jgi:hypothetical protein
VEKGAKNKKQFLRQRKGKKKKRGSFSGGEKRVPTKTGISPVEKQGQKKKTGFLRQRKGEKKQNRVFSGGEAPPGKKAASPPVENGALNDMFYASIHFTPSFIVLLRSCHACCIYPTSLHSTLSD